MKTQILELQQGLLVSSVFRGLLDEPVIKAIEKLLKAVKDDDMDVKLNAYGDVALQIYQQGGDLAKILKKLVLDSMNPYLQTVLDKKTPSKELQQATSRELKMYDKLAKLSSSEIAKEMNYDGFLPQWSNSDICIEKEFFDMIDNLACNGYGIFSDSVAFKVSNGKLVPIKAFHPQKLDEFYGYERERLQVYNNTKSFAQGHPANNVLLYGDAGTGKSSTIKACAGALSGSGIRLVEIEKHQLGEIPAVLDLLANNPLKFIFFIDDLSFASDDDTFCYMKSILEGHLAGCGDNVLIYATSNRRHLVKESSEERLGSDLHLNDTLQETLSLSARFGLTITFSKPEQDLYREIVTKMAKEYDIEVNDELFKQAEAFAIRQSGRSPRTARQFLLKISGTK